MKQLLLVLLFTFLLSACKAPDYNLKSDTMVDGYYIYEMDQSGPLCNTYYQEVFYSGPIYNYGFRFQGCSPGMTYYIDKAGEYIYLQDAINQGIITIESLLPELEQLERDPEIISSEEADYYWLDFHVNGFVVRAYAGGVCDQSGQETFEIEGTTYYYNASGCLKDHILYIQIDGTYLPVADLIQDGTIDATYLIPLLTEETN
jgi:hypothetical protein